MIKAPLDTIQITRMLHGVGTALITPFNKDNTVDYDALEKLVEQQIADGVTYIVVLGTTAEAATLTDAEKSQVVNTILRVNYGRVPLVLGLGGNCTAQVVRQLQSLPDYYSEFCAILSVCPYYNKPSQEGLYRHFDAIAKASPLPVILYNVPGRTGVNLLPQTVFRIWQSNQCKVVGVKEASGDMQQIKDLIHLMPDGIFTVVSGDDALAAQVRLAGGGGVISVLSNACVKEVKKIVDDKDMVLQERINPLISLLFKEGNPTGIKALLCLQGKINNVLRLPLVACSTSLQGDIEVAYQQLL